MVYVDKKIYKTFLTPFTVVALTFLLMIDLNNLIISDIYGYYKVSDFSILVLLGFIAVVFAVACLFGYFWYAPKCRVAVKPKFDIEKRINYKFVIIIFLIGLAAYFISLLRDINAYGFGNLKGKASGIFAHLSQLAFLIAPLLWSYSKSIKSKIISFCLIALTFFMAFLYGGKYGILINFVYIMMYMLIRKDSNVKRILKYIAVIGLAGLGVFIVVYAVIPSFTSSGADNSSNLAFSIEHFFYYLMSPIIANNIKYIKAQFVTGCVLMVDCNYINGYGLLTEKFFHGEEDYNFCYRLKKKKLRVGVDLTSRIYHKVGQSINRSDDNTKKLKSNIVHYTNRVIDYKEFYGSFRWRLWRIFYINLVILKRRLSGLDKGAAKLLKRKIYFYSNNFDNVKWDVFSEIMNDPDIC